MGYRTLAACVEDLGRTDRLRPIEVEIDPYLEAAYIQRRVYARGGPAIWFRRLKGCSFTAVANLFGTIDRARFIFRDSLASVSRLVALKSDPGRAARRFWEYADLPVVLRRALPRLVGAGPILAGSTTIGRLPQIVSWPRDGGPFVTLPAVYTEDPGRPGWRHSNLGMYRVQLGGNAYEADFEVGLHYQIHRGIGIHHAAAIARGEPLAVNIIVGGPPALAFAAVMPLPEGLPEAAFAAVLAGHRMRWVRSAVGLPMPAEADFVIAGRIDPSATKPEGPFGDHLGYYSLEHEFPFMKVSAVHHRPGAIWPMTSVGRPPQEDTTFGELIHEMVGPAVSAVLPGVRAVHAVDAAGVHPLLLAIGSERYVPYAARHRPMEILTQASAILGQGQMSLAKYLLIADDPGDGSLEIGDIAGFIRHILERVDWAEDLHFHTRTTIDTLDYSGHGLNMGSKLVIAAAGPKRRELSSELRGDLSLPQGFDDPRVAMPGIVTVRGPRFEAGGGEIERNVARFVGSPAGALRSFPLCVIVDDSEFAARDWRNWIWVTFTRSNPAVDVHGFDALTYQKHWGCRGPLVIDARQKPHHAPPLEDDPAVVRRVESMAVRGGPLEGLI
jgi:4-hydroxy-3-polyprenylbenzoate decarboxylase